MFWDPRKVLMKKWMAIKYMRYQLPTFHLIVEVKARAMTVSKNWFRKYITETGSIFAKHEVSAVLYMICNLCSLPAHEYGQAEYVEFETSEFTHHVQVQQASTLSEFKNELLYNDLYCITEHDWNNVHEKALGHVESNKITKRHTANRSDSHCGIVEGEPIKLECVIAIMLFCNFDDLRAAFLAPSVVAPLEEAFDGMIEGRFWSNSFYWFGMYVLSHGSIFTSFFLVEFNPYSTPDVVIFPVQKSSA